MSIDFEANFRIRVSLRWTDLIPIVFTIAEWTLL